MTLKLSHPTCYYCQRFITFEQALVNVAWIQAPGVMDPEPYEISWCDECGATRRDDGPSGR